MADGLGSSIFGAVGGAAIVKRRGSKQRNRLRPTATQGTHSQGEYNNGFERKTAKWSSDRFYSDPVHSVDGSCGVVSEKARLELRRGDGVDGSVYGNARLENQRAARR